MNIKRTLLVLAVLFGLIGYYLYCPIPDGYSAASATQLRIFLATLKIVHIAVSLYHSFYCHNAYYA